MAKIAETSTNGGLTARAVAVSDGWSVEDVICTCGPEDRPFEEQHTAIRVAIVVSGTFQYKTTREPELMAPGALLLGNAGQAFECARMSMGAAIDACRSPIGLTTSIGWPSTQA